MKRPLFVAIVLAGCFTAPVVTAQSGNERALAEAFFQDGRRLFDEGKVAEACAKFGESQRIAPAVGTLLNLAVCHEKQGLLATAWAEFTTVSAQASGERKAFAQERVRAIEPLVPKVVVSAEEVAPGMQIKLDATSMSEGALGSSIPVDPGEHSVEVSAPDRKPWSRKFQVSAGKTETLVIPRLEPSVATAPAPATAPVPAPAPTPAAQPAAPVDQGVQKSDAGSQRTLGYVALGVGVLGVAAGSYFGVRTFSKRDDADAHCPNKRCDDTGSALIEDARDAATLSTIAFGVGIVGVAAGSWLLLTADASSESAYVGVSGRF
ncbi:MAG TPA: hypothetical protein VM686_39270 [Polyangiaceae bacterium]|nr:hypothetical protein [Polyangiaceae bacterium]